jgi:hypothetical protein
MNAEKILQRADGKRRVLLARRKDGKYGLVVEYWYENVFEGKLIARGWAVLDRPASIFDTVEIAEREARATFPWLV